LKYDPHNQDPPNEKEYKLKYNTNNSGGNWWLKDEDWNNLEKAGWIVWWKKNDPTSINDRWLGALATKAEKEFDTIKEGLIEFEKVTKQSVTDSGCSCCGPPHDFSWIRKDGEHDYMTSADIISTLKINSKDELILRLMRNV